MMGRPKLIEKGKKMVIYIDENLENLVKENAKKLELSPSQLVRKIMKEYFERI